MSVVVLGLSHRSAPMELLEAVASDPARVALLATAVSHGENVDEAVVVATCNRVEVYAEAVTFHGAVNEIGEALAAVDWAGLRQNIRLHHAAARPSRGRLAGCRPIAPVGEVS